jgi:alpha-aminoadipic semialdehyde synthase
VGIRREDKSRWERRVPITPRDAAELAQQHGIALRVQPSLDRVFSEDEYRAAGATVEENLEGCPVIFGVKEIPVRFFEPGKTYVFFSHVIKGQPYNMPMLRRILELGCTLIDYERVVDDSGRRLIFFGRHAGIAGSIETLWALGRRLAWEGIPNPFERLLHAHEYHDVTQAQLDVARAGEAIRAGGIPEAVRPLIIGVTGYGNVARGAWEVLDLLPVERIEPDTIPLVRAQSASSGTNGERGSSLSWLQCEGLSTEPLRMTPKSRSELGLDRTEDFGRSTIYAATFREEHLVEPLSGAEGFDLQDYYARPEGYRGIFECFVPYLTAVVNAIYWDPRYPRLITKAFLKELFREDGGTMFGGDRPRLRVIGDISCDIEGSMECTVRAMQPDDPVFVYHPATGQVTSGVAGEGVVVMAVDILPSELPRDASADFSRVLKPFVPAMACADYSRPFEELDLPPEIKRAVIVHRGELTPAYAHLAEYL